MHDSGPIKTPSTLYQSGIRGHSYIFGTEHALDEINTMNPMLHVCYEHCLSVIIACMRSPHDSS